MASNAARTHLIKNLQNRSYTACAARSVVGGAYNHNVQIDNLRNKVVCASLDSPLPLSRVAVVVKAGSRYDPAEVPGLSHVLRASAGLTTKGASTFAIIRNLQQMGANLQVTGGRDTITYTLEATSDKIDFGLKFLNDVVTLQTFKPWELKDNIARIKYELASLPAEARALDLLHKAAYRSGLGNTLYAKPHRISSIGTETLQHHVNQYFTSSRTTVVGQGVSDGSLKKFALELELGAGLGGDEGAAAKYQGGVVHKDAANGGRLVTAVAVESAGLNSDQTLAYTVLSYALGGQSSIVHSAGQSPLGKAFDLKPIGACAFNAVHADSGLFGIVVSAPASHAKDAVKKAYEVSTGKLSDADVTRAKNQLISDILFASQEGESFLHDVATQLPATGAYVTPDQLVDKVGKVSTADVAAAAKAFSSGKKSIGAYGDASGAIYVEDL